MKTGAEAIVKDAGILRAVGTEGVLLDFPDPVFLVLILLSWYFGFNCGYHF